MEPLLDDGELSAQTTPEHPGSSTSLQMCLIVIGGEHFAIDLRSARGVFEVASITPVPGIPTSLVGVANLRGSVVPIADLRPSMGMPASGIAKYVLVVHHDIHRIGLLIDDVPSILSVPSENILPTSSSGVSPGFPFLSGLLSVDNCISGILEMSRIMASVERLHECGDREIESDPNCSRHVRPTQ